MATASDDITISGNIESTVYYRNGKPYISREGKEISIIKLHPEVFPVPLLLAHTGSTYSIVKDVSTSGAYGGSDPLERISHDLSVFWSQLSSIKSSDNKNPENGLNQFDELVNGVFDAMHAAGRVISEEQEKTRAALSQVESLQGEVTKLKQELSDNLETTKNDNQTRDELKKNSDSLVKFLSLLSDVLKIPLLHKMCLLEDDVSSIIGVLVKALNWNIHEEANFCFVDQMSETRFRPIHIAAMKGGIEIMKELYKLDPSVADSVTGNLKWTVLDCAAYTSVEAFELAKSWMKNPQDMISTALNRQDCWLLRIAAFGGNLSLLQLLLSRDFISEYNCDSLIKNAICGKRMNVLEWLISMRCPGPAWDIIKSMAKLSLADIVSDDQVAWLFNASSDVILSSPMFYVNRRSTILQNFLAHHSLVEELKHASKLENFQLGSVDDRGRTLLHVACEANSVAVLDWVLVEFPNNREVFDALDLIGSHLIHTAAAHGSLDCLKWICSNLPKFQYARGSAYFMQLKRQSGATALDLALGEGVLKWIKEVHGVD